MATLTELYNSEPVGSVQVGKSYGMSHHQVLIYLQMAKDATESDTGTLNCHLDTLGILEGDACGDVGQPSH